MTASNLKFFTGGKRLPAADVVAKLMNSDKGTARENAMLLLQDANSIGYGLDATLHQMVESPIAGLNGNEALFHALGVPLNLKDDAAIAAFAASSTSFMTNEGLKVLLPSLVNNLLRAQQNTAIVERVEDLILQTRMVKSSVLQKEIVYDKESNDSYATHRIAEGANIPVRTLKAGTSNVKFFKTGHGIEVSYEFIENMTPDILVPYANRIAFERSQTEHLIAVETLVNGESTDPNSNNGAIKQDKLDTIDGKSSTALRQRAEGFIKWLISCARAGRPIDTIVIGWDTILELQFMFPVTDATGNAAVGLGGVASGTQLAQMNVSIARGINLSLNVVISSQIEPNQILGFRKGETLERLIKSNSQIDEMERAIRSQTILYTHTIISGFTLAYGDSRRLLTWT